MADYLLDTNIIRYWYDKRCPEYPKVMAHVQAVRKPSAETDYVPRLYVSAVTIGEIWWGHKVTPTPEMSKQSELLDFLRKECPEPLDVVAHVGESYGELKAWLFNTCSPKTMRTRAGRLSQLFDPITGEKLGAGENDLWIAAQAMTHNMVLVTHDSHGNFGRVLHQFAAMLHPQDWAQ